MAEAKNNFLKSKMNKDLDDRLVPKGEYRHGQNISIAKSEGQDVGALENILGNDLISNFLPSVDFSLVSNVEVIGHLMDVKNDRIIVFMTNYVDTSSDNLSNFSSADAAHYIGVYNISTKNSSIVVLGQFLNFSKTHEIYAVNIIDDLLFWTDNRNQPRKINLSRANPNNLAIPTYYTTEDTISVSKYYPHKTIDLIVPTIFDIRLTVPGTAYAGLTLPAMNLPTENLSGSFNGQGLTVDVTAVNLGTGAITGFNINNAGYGYQNGDAVVVCLVIGQIPFGAATIMVSTEDMSTMTDVISEFLPDGTTNNPYRQPYGSSNITWKGDPEYLKDKFVRFSYRFKFDDGEYSLIAPFTQTCFIPKQDGYFIGDDDAKTFKSTEVDFMENKVNNIELIIDSPTGKWNNINETMKIAEVDILYKQAGQNVIKIVDTIDFQKLRLVDSSILTYDYTSSKPWKTLPDKEILRVHDQVPVRAAVQEVIGNRIVYGNYIDKPTPPSTVNYSCGVVDKEENVEIEYQNQTLKQNRTYQVGIVLSDKYGRQSTVILSSVDESKFSTTIRGSTLFHKYKESPFSDWPTGELLDVGTAPSTPGDIWDGDNLLLTFWDIISSIRNSTTGEPGLYDAVTNPLGWYSYKIVVKQTEQDYYNIYFPGILNGYIDGEAISTGATDAEPICHFVLSGDNINKVPRDLSLIGPNQKTFRTGRPSAQEDPSYYQFVDSSGLEFTVDPFSAEGEQLLKERDREKDLDSGSQITNASVKLSLRLNNVAPASGLATTLTSTSQSYSGTNLDIVSTIGTGSELGLWDPAAIPPFNTANVFYGYKNNPYVAKTNVSFPLTTGLTGPHPNSGVLSFTMLMDPPPPGSLYVAGSKNIPCTIPTSAAGWSGTISGFKINIDGGLSNNEISIADIGTGWPTLVDSTISIPGCKISGAGDGLAQFTLVITNDKSSGNMAPSLAVYETQPLESKLNIYWETSTNGLIEELNTAILAGDASTPVTLVGFSSSPIDYLQNESMNIGADATGPIYADNANGNPVPILAAVLAGAFDMTSSPSNRVSEFSIDLNVAGGFFKIKTAAYFMCNKFNQTEGSFNFNVALTVPTDTYSLDGSTMIRWFTIGPYTLGNTSPTFISLTNEGAFSAETPEFLVNPAFDVPFTVSWNHNSPPYIINRIKFNNIIEDTASVYNNATGVYTCNVTGSYDIQAKVKLKAEFQPIGQASTKSAKMCSSMIGNLYLRNVGTGAIISPKQEFCIVYNRRIQGNAKGFTNWSGQGIEHHTGSKIIAGGGAAMNAYAWPLSTQRPDVEVYKVVTSNIGLTAGDQVELVAEVAFVGDEQYGNIAHGYAFKDLGGITNKFYDGNSWLHTTSGIYAATNIRGYLNGGFIHTYNAQNGSHNTPANSLKTISTTFAITSDPSGLFYLDNSANINGQVKLMNIAGGETGTTYPITITAEDGFGATTDYNTFVLLS
jgi:hypothetical protein